MALVRTEIGQGWSSESRQGVLRGVRDAVATSLRVPLDDPTVQLFEVQGEHRLLPGNSSERYTLITVTMFLGRSTETKARLVSGVTDEVVKVGVPAQDIDIVLLESEVENWARGGTLASRDRLTFDVDI